MFICRQVKYSRLKINDNFGSGEKFVRQVKTFVGQMHFQSTCPGATELKVYFSGPDFIYSIHYMNTYQLMVFICASFIIYDNVQKQLGKRGSSSENYTFPNHSKYLHKFQ